MPHFAIKISNQNLMLGHIVSRAPTVLSYNKRPSYMKDQTTKDNWTFGLGVGDGVDIRFYVIV